MTWQTLHHGSPDEARVAAGFLDGFGIALRVVDASGVEVPRDRLTAAGPEVRVQVHASDAASAADLLADVRPATRRPATDPRLDRLGLSIRACAVSGGFAPLGLLLAPTYLLRSSRAEARPREHGWTLAGIAACVPASFIYLILVGELIWS